VEEKHLLSREEGAALVTVLVAIIVLLPPTILLATLALRGQRQSVDFRDRIAQELAAEGCRGGAGASLGERDRSLSERRHHVRAPEHRRSRFGVRVSARGRGPIARRTPPRRLAATSVDLNATGTDPEGRVVYQFRKVEIYLVEIDVLAPRLAPAPQALRRSGEASRRKPPDSGFDAPPVNPLHYSTVPTSPRLTTFSRAKPGRRPPC
jgi:hypothetical protein